LLFTNATILQSQHFCNFSIFHFFSAVFIVLPPRLSVNVSFLFSITKIILINEFTKFNNKYFQLFCNKSIKKTGFSPAFLQSIDNQYPLYPRAESRKPFCALCGSVLAVLACFYSTLWYNKVY
jgi:hypothetical protein